MNNYFFKFILIELMVVLWIKNTNFALKWYYDSQKSSNESVTFEQTFYFYWIMMLDLQEDEEELIVLYPLIKCMFILLKGFLCISFCLGNSHVYYLSIIFNTCSKEKDITVFNQIFKKNNWYLEPNWIVCIAADLLTGRLWKQFSM